MIDSLRGRIYANHPTNTGRQPELDLAKAIIVFFLALVHCTIECIPESGLVSGIPYLLDSVIGGPLSAPTLMFAMGVGMTYTSRNRPADYVRRGVRLFGVGFLLNICRYLIPWLIGYGITGNRERYIEPLLYLVMENDILQFAGMAMVVIALFKTLRLTDYAMLAVSFGLSLLGTALVGVDVNAPMGNILLGYLIGTEDAAGMVRSYFPLCNWLVVPICGYLFGERLRYVKNKALFYKTLSPPCLAVVILYFPLGIHFEWGMFGEGQNCYYHLTTSDAVICLCAAVGVLGIWFLLAPQLPTRVQGLVSQISRDINAVYCIHWVLLSFIVNVLLFALRGSTGLPVTVTLLLGVGISVLAITMAWLWHSFKKPGEE